MPPSPAPVVVADSITRVAEAEARGAVIVNASHGGIYAAYLAAKLGAAAAIFNDAGVGRDRAGIAGLDYLQELGIAAATIGHDTARIGEIPVGTPPISDGARVGFENHFKTHLHPPRRELASPQSRTPCG